MALGKRCANLKLETENSERRMKKMGTKAYFMINVAKDRVGPDGQIDVVKELEAMPGVEAVEPVFGIYDLIVTVEAPVIEVTHSVNKIMEKDWVKRLHILRREPVELAETEKGKRLLLGKALRVRAGKRS
jgi:DNA-binding Lrp family transcriptional regulator